MHAIFSGAITFGLITIPIKIYAATEEKEIKFHNLCPDCLTPLTYKRWCPKCDREVKWAEIKKGFKISKERWVVLEKEELEKIKLPSTKAVEIVQFVDLAQIDPIFFEKSYYIVPEEMGIKAYSLFVEALRLTNRAAIGRVVIRNKEYLVALRAFKKGLVMHVLYYLGEIRDIEKLKELENLVVVSKEELELAKSLIEKLSTEEFELEKFKDRYTDALKEMIKAKIEGKAYETKAEEKVEETKNLLEALKASVENLEKKKKAKSE